MPRYWLKRFFDREVIGDYFVAATLSLCLVVNFGGAGIVGAYVVLSIIATMGRSILGSIEKFRNEHVSNASGKLYVLIVASTAINILIMFYHKDSLSTVENDAKQLLVAYGILYLMQVRSHRIVLYGAAIGAILGCAAALYEFVALDVARPGGSTNPIRFGMIAVLFSVLSLAGFLFDVNSRPAKALLLAGTFSGLVAAVLSGSRGAVLVAPFIALLLLPRMWNRSRALALWVAGALVVVFALVVVLDVGSLIVRSREAFSNVFGYLSGERPLAETLRDRIVMLQMSWKMFTDHPLLGVGDSGWIKAVAEQVNSGNPLTELDLEYNQPHNQYANDFAKGGFLGGLAGVALIFVPLFLFLKSSPFSDRRSTMPALLGVITCAAYAIFSLTESLMALSMPASVYAVLVCYLMAASDLSDRPAKQSSLARLGRN